MSATGWVVLGVLAVLLVWTVTVYNRLVQLQNRIANALGQIDVQLKLPIFGHVTRLNLFAQFARILSDDMNLPLGWVADGSTVQLVRDWIRTHIAYQPVSDSDTSATHTFVTRAGVCRDFAHLALTLCRCMNIPARYCTGYLGDVGTEPPYGPMDFAAWFEVWLGDRWYTFDARNNVPRIGRVLMARGRDACDVALTSTFGANTLEGFRVWTDVVAD